MSSDRFVFRLRCNCGGKDGRIPEKVGVVVGGVFGDNLGVGEVFGDIHVHESLVSTTSHTFDKSVRSRGLTTSSAGVSTPNELCLQTSFMHPGDIDCERVKLVAGSGDFNNDRNTH